MRVFFGSTVKTAFDPKPVEKTLGVPAEAQKKNKNKVDLFTTRVPTAWITDGDGNRAMEKQVICSAQAVIFVMECIQTLGAKVSRGSARNSVQVHRCIVQMFTVHILGL